MTDQTSSSESGLSDKVAFLRAAIPPVYSDTNLKQLFHSGRSEFKTDGEPDGDKLIDKMETFGIQAWDWQENVESDGEFPPVGSPGALAVVATYAIIRLKQMPIFQTRVERSGGKNIRPMMDIREYYVWSLLELLEQRDDDLYLTVLKELGEVLYRKDSRDGQLYYGNTVEKITVPEGSSRRHLEIPVAAASKDCLSYERSTLGVEDVDVIFQNNSVYVPIGILTDDWLTYLEHGFKQLVRVQEEMLTPSQIDWLALNDSRLEDRISTWDEENNVGRLYTGEDTESRIIKQIRNVLTNQDYQLDKGEWFTASQIANAIDVHLSRAENPEHFLFGFNDTDKIAGLLSRNKDNYYLEYKKTEDGQPDLYSVKEERGAKTLDPDPLENIFELPCMANMDQRLKEEEPVRKDLFSFVRMVMWLEDYYEERPGNQEGRILIDDVVEDILDLFERYPWFDPEITEEQTKYEYRRGEQKERYFPVGCHNDDMQRYCIGRENCPYSIYGSLPFTQELYGRLSDDDTGF